MPKTNYPWLLKAQEKALKRKSPIKDPRVMGGAPLSAQMGLTGFGEDGQLQPSNPVGMIGNTMVHEGEGLNQNQDGSVQVTPASQMSQSQLKTMEQEQNIPGMQQGGIIRPPVIRPQGPGGLGQGGTPIQGQGGFTPRTPVNPNVQNIFQNQNQGTQTGKIDPITAPDPTPVGLQDFVGPVQGNQIGPQTMTTPITGPDLGIDMPDIIPNVDQGDQGSQIDPETTAFNQAQQKLQKLSEGQDELTKQIQMEERERFKGEEQAARGSLEQQMSQLGVEGRDALTERAMASRGVGAQEVALEGDLRKQQQAQAFQAAMKLPDVAMAGMQFEHGKDMQAFAQQLASGDFDGAAQSFSNIFGKSIDFTQGINDQNFDNFQNSMGLVSQSIASGMSPEQAMNSLKQSGAWENMGLTEGDFNTMYKNMELQSDPMFQAINAFDNLVSEGIISQEQADIYKEGIVEVLTNPDGYKVENGWAVFDKAGNEKGFFTNEEEAKKFMGENPGFEMSDFMENHLTAKGDPDTTTGPDGEDLTSKQEFEKFKLDEDPSSDQEKISYDDWVKAGKPSTWEDYEKAVSSGLSQFTTNLQEKYDKEGWPPPEYDDYTKKHHKDAKGMVEQARKDFLSGESNVYSMEQGDFAEYETVEQLVKNDAIKKGNVITVEGYSNPLVVYDMSTTEGGLPDGGSVTLYDMTTGKAIVWRDYKGKLNTEL